MIEAKTLEGHLNETAALAEAVRASMQAIGLGLFAKRRLSNALTAVKVPAGIDGEKLTDTMRDVKGVTLAGGQGEMKGKIFRIAHMGYITKEDLSIGIQILCETLNEFGFKCSAKQATEQFAQTLRQNKEQFEKAAK